MHPLCSARRTVAEQIAFISSWTALAPGDLIAIVAGESPIGRG
jgi:hypothetical protein